MAARNSAEGHRVIAAINGDVWGLSSPSMYAPNGLHVQNGELMVATRVGKATFGVRADNSPFLGAPGLVASLTDTAGRVTQVARLNQWRRTGELILYTSRFGGSTLTNTSGTEVVLNAVPTALRRARRFTGTVAAVRKDRGNTSLAPGRMVLSGSGAGATALNRLAVGQVVTLNVGVTPGWETVRQAIGGREWIIQNGAIDIFPRPDSADVSHPRSVIAQKADGQGDPRDDRRAAAGLQRRDDAARRGPLPPGPRRRVGDEPRRRWVDRDARPQEGRHQRLDHQSSVRR